MADVEFARTEIADQVSRPVVAEITDVAARAAALAREAPAVTILDEGLHLEIEVAAPGWTETVAVASPVRPGAVRGAVEKVLRDLGMTRL